MPTRTTSRAPRRTAAFKIGIYLGWDQADVKAARYQATDYDRPVYAIGDAYYASGSTAKPPQATHADGFIRWTLKRHDWGNETYWIWEGV